MPHNPTRILVFAGSTRGESYNSRLAALAVKTLVLLDAEVSHISLADYELPIYNGDLEAEQGVPEAAEKLRRLFTSHQGIFIASPEYNASVTPLTKNTIDWVSRTRATPEHPESPWKGRIFALGAASPGYYGGFRSLMALRQILEIGLGATVLPEQVAVPNAAHAFGSDGGLVQERATKQLEALAGRLMEEAGRYVL